jgi:hypothetical protein
MSQTTTEVFFRPEPIRQEAATIPAVLYNRCRLMLSRCPRPHVFVPIRSMQYLAVIDAEEVIFVDSQAYAVRDGEGGRMILLSWRFHPARKRESLSEPVSIELLYHHAKAEEVQRRIQGELAKALQELESRQAQIGCRPRVKKVLDFPAC